MTLIQRRLFRILGLLTTLAALLAPATARAVGLEDMPHPPLQRRQTEEALLKLLEHEAQERGEPGWQSVVRQLVDQKSHHPKLVYELIRALPAKPDDKAAIFTAGELGRLRLESPEIIEALVERISHNSGGALADAAADALVSIAPKDPKHVRRIAAALHGQVEAATRAAKVLRLIKAEGVAKELLESLKRVGTYLRHSGHFRYDSASDALYRPMRDLERNLTDALGSLKGQDEIRREGLILALGSTDDTTRTIAIHRIVEGTLGHDDLVLHQAVLNALDDTDTGVRASAAGYLGQSKRQGGKTLARLTAILKNEKESPSVRIAAAEALGYAPAHTPESYLALARASSDAANPQLAKTALFSVAIANYDAAEHVEALLELLQVHDPKLARKAAEQLGKSKPGQHTLDLRDRLVELSKHGQAHTRRAAAAVLAEVFPDAYGTHNALMRLLEPGKEVASRNLAFEALAEMAKSKAYRDKPFEEYLHLAVARALDREKNKDLILAGIEALEATNAEDEFSERVLMKFLRGGDVQIGARARDALSKLSLEPSTIDALRRLYASSPQRAKADILQIFASKSNQARASGDLADLLKTEPNEILRASAARALSGAEDLHAQLALSDALADPKPQVRQAASEALLAQDLVPDPEARYHLSGLLDHPRAETRDLAASALPRFWNGDEAIVERLALRALREERLSTAMTQALLDMDSEDPLRIAALDRYDTSPLPKNPPTRDSVSKALREIEERHPGIRALAAAEAERMLAPPRKGRIPLLLDRLRAACARGKK